MKEALKYLENHSVPHNEDGMDITEDVSLSDAKYAANLAVLEFIYSIRELEPSIMRAMVEDRVRELHRQKVRLP